MINKTATIMLSSLLLPQLAGAVQSQPTTEEANQKPNIVLFLVDDMGWMDSGVYGSTYYQTPNMDRLAKQSMRFTDAYAQPLCAPTRASILTGQHTPRHGITSATGHMPPQPGNHKFLPETAPTNMPLLMPESKNYLDPSYYTLAQALKDAGYRTGHFGKWHLGLTRPHWPEQFGYDVAWHAEPSAGPPRYFSPYGVSQDGEPKAGNPVGTITDGPKGEYITDRLTDEAIRFIENEKDNPFFLNLSQFAVHGPWGHKEEYTKEFAKTNDPRGVQGNPIMASMLKSVDESLGRVLEKLDELGLTENTLFIFFSDNGGNFHSMSEIDRRRDPDHPQVVDWRKWAGYKGPTSNLPLKEGKSRLYEGGVRVPLIVRYPGVIKAGTISDAIVGCIDLYPTILDLIDVDIKAQHIIDGISFAQVLEQRGSIEREAYFTWFPHIIPGVSVRKGDWKLIRRFLERPDSYEGLYELFNLKEDIGETKNLAATMPEKVKELDALIDAFVLETGAIYPQPNPAYRPNVGNR
jgi:arylsulfatase A-like enzyme